MTSCGTLVRQDSKTEASYRCALINFQHFAEASYQIGHPVPPLPRTPPGDAGDYYSWLKKHGFRNASIRLYLSAIRQYLFWLEASRHLPAKLYMLPRYRRS